MARPAVIDRLAALAEHTPTRLSRAGASIVQDAERYLAFFAVLSEPTPLGKAEIAAQLRGRI